MKIHFLKSATTIIESDDVKILTDPWLVDGEYYGSWFHYPPYDFDPKTFDDIDFIYISHIHPDHFSRATLSQLNKDIPVLIHNYDIKFLKRNIESLWFYVRELPNNQRTHLKDNVHINIFAADNCNPELCMKHFGCGKIEAKFGSTQIDSLSVIDDGNFSVLNVNDCPYGLASVCEKPIREQYGTVDFMLVGYAGAGPFPQCIANLNSAEKTSAAASKQHQFIKQGKQFLDLFKPRFFMPFAGTYTLGGSLSKLNKLRGVPEIEDAFTKLDTSGAYKGVMLNTSEHFDLKTESPSVQYQPINREEKAKYIADILASKKYTFESDSMPDLSAFESLIPSAFQRMNQIRESIAFSTKTKVIIQLCDEKSVIISLDEKAIGRGAEGWKIVNSDEANKLNPSVRFTVDPRLLHNILKGPRFGHWNNAEIGSHIEFYRQPEQFERGLYYCMNFFFGDPVRLAKLPPEKTTANESHPVSG